MKEKSKNIDRKKYTERYVIKMTEELEARKRIFRAWDKFDKKMILWKDILKNENMLKEILLNSVRYIPLQAVNIKAENQQEIYEADIVRMIRIDDDKGWKSQVGEQGVVYFDTTWGIKFDCLDHTQRTADHWKGEVTRYDDLRDIIIVGNIFEHPDLLNQKFLGKKFYK